LSGVKCTNNMKIYKKMMALLLISTLFLSACGSKEMPMSYKSSNSIVTTTVVSSKVEPFATNLAVTDSDVEGRTGVEIEEQSPAGLFDVNGKQVLYAKDIFTEFPPASLTKIMTALVAIKYGNTEDVITCSDEVTNIDVDATKIGLKAGDQLTMNQALHALLINSANDAAIAIAEHISGSVEEFCALMNEEARMLGATHTTFKNPNGLTEEGHVTTVYDLYLITNEAIKYSLFNEIIQMTEYETVYNDSAGNEKSMSFKTTNLFLRGDYSAPERVTVIGGKTGTTNAAGNCLVLIVKDTGGNPYIGVILRASQRTIVNEEMAEILREID